jgi:hypothetical protein
MSISNNTALSLPQTQYPDINQSQVQQQRNVAIAKKLDKIQKSSDKSKHSIFSFSTKLKIFKKQNPELSKEQITNFFQKTYKNLADKFPENEPLPSTAFVKAYATKNKAKELKLNLSNQQDINNAIEVSAQQAASHILEKFPKYQHRVDAGDIVHKSTGIYAQAAIYSSVAIGTASGAAAGGIVGGVIGGAIGAFDKLNVKKGVETGAIILGSVGATGGSVAGAGLGLVASVPSTAVSYVIAGATYFPSRMKAKKMQSKINQQQQMREQEAQPQESNIT